MAPTGHLDHDFPVSILSPKLKEEGTMLVKDGGRKVVVEVPGRGHLPGSGEARLARELFSGRFRPTQTLQLREIATKYELDEKTVWKAFAEFQTLGMVTLSEDLSVIVRSPNLAEMQEAYQIR